MMAKSLVVTRVAVLSLTLDVAARRRFFVVNSFMFEPLLYRA